MPTAARAGRFVQQAGYRLEQVERFSSLARPPAPALLDALERDELDTWTDHCRRSTWSTSPC